MKVKWIFWIGFVVIIILGTSILSKRIDQGDDLRTFDKSSAPGLFWIKVNKSLPDASYQYWHGSWMTLDDLLHLSEKENVLSGKDFFKYNFTEIQSDVYQRIYEITDFDMLFELRVKWDVEKMVGYSMTDDPVYNKKVSEAILVAKDGQNTQVDIQTGDVKTYIKEHQENPAYRTFAFSYYPIEVNGTTETTAKFEALWEDGETYLISNPNNVTAIKIDDQDEFFAWIEKMEKELKFTDTAAIENVSLHFTWIESTIEPIEPKFLLYLPEGNLTHQYSVSSVEKHGRDLYLSIEKVPRIDENAQKDGCLIALQIARDGGEPSTITDVTTIHIDVID